VARLARVEALETPHHVTQRGNGRRVVFETDNDRLVYLGLLQQHAKLQRLAILGYCLMPNHVHLIVVPQRADALRTALRNAHGRYAAYLNARQATSGHVWQGRYYSCPMDEDHLWTALRYAERNPVRAGMVRDAAEFPWSSARIHVGGGWDGLIDPGPWSARWTLDEWREFLAATEFERESEAIRRSTHSGRPLGSAHFVERLETEMARPLVARHGGRPKKQEASREPAQSLLAAV
jgi:putative transposase